MNLMQNLVPGFLVFLLGACQSAPATTKWDLLPNMKTGRSEISATVADSVVYIAGGIGFFRTLKSCEAFDTSSQHWSSCPDLPRPLHHVALASDGHEVYASGGYTNLSFDHDSPGKLWRLDRRLAAWVELADLPEPVGEHVMVESGGDLYIIGGRTQDGDSGALWRMDLESRKWTRLSDMPTERHSFATTLVDQEIWIIGGRSSALGTAIRTIEIYDFENDEWRTGPDLPFGRGGHIAAYVSGQVHVVGGEVFEPNRIVNRHDVYDTETARWIENAAPNRPRHGMASVVVAQEIYLFGGGSRPALHTAYSASRTAQKLTATDSRRRSPEY